MMTAAQDGNSFPLREPLSEYVLKLSQTFHHLNQLRRTNMLRWIISLLIAIVVSGATGYYLGSGNVRVEKQVVTEKGETKVVIRDHIVTVTKVVHPDGTTTETTKTEDKDKTSEEHHSSTDTSVVTTPVLPNYSLGVSYGVRYSELLGDVTRPTPEQVQLQFGRRFLGPVWGEVGAGMKQVTLGVRVEF